MRRRSRWNAATARPGCRCEDDPNKSRAVAQRFRCGGRRHYERNGGTRREEAIGGNPRAVAEVDEIEMDAAREMFFGVVAPMDTEEEVQKERAEGNSCLWWVVAPVTDAGLSDW